MQNDGNLFPLPWERARERAKPVNALETRSEAGRSDIYARQKTQ